MDLKCLPSELIQEILDRVPFVDWLNSVVLVCKEWKRLCQTSQSQNKCFIINDTTLKLGHRTKTSMIHNIVSTYQVTGLEVYCFEAACTTDRPWPDVIAASKQLKWLTLSLAVEQLILTESEPFDIEQLSIVYLNWWQFPIVTFRKKFPKVRIFSIPLVFPVMVYPPDWSFEFARKIQRYYVLLANTIVTKLILCFSNNIGQKDVQELMQTFTTLETYMEKKFGIELVVRDLFVLVPHLELFKEAYYKNGLPYEYYRALHYTPFAYACYREAFDTIKFLIDSGITSLEKELQFYTRTIETHKKMHMTIYLPEYLPFFLDNETFLALDVHNRKAILDYLISQGLTCATKGKKGEIMHEAFGVSHPVVAYVTLRSPPKLAAATIYEIMSTNPQQYRTYLHDLYYKASKETQEEVKKLLLQDFDFSNVLYYVVESRDLQLIRNFVEEFTIDLNKYKEAVSECPAMEECTEVQDYVNAFLKH